MIQRYYSRGRYMTGKVGRKLGQSSTALQSTQTQGVTEKTQSRNKKDKEYLEDKLRSIIAQQRPAIIPARSLTPRSPLMPSCSTKSLRSSSPQKHFLLPPKSSKDRHRKTLVLDLDETLIHSSFQPLGNAQITLAVLCTGS